MKKIFGLLLATTLLLTGCGNSTVSSDELVESGENIETVSDGDALDKTSQEDDEELKLIMYQESENKEATNNEELVEDSEEEIVENERISFGTFSYQVDAEHPFTIVDFELPEGFSAEIYDLCDYASDWFAQYNYDEYESWEGEDAPCSYIIMGISEIEITPNGEFVSGLGNPVNVNIDEVDHEYFTHLIYYHDEDGAFYESYVHRAGEVETGDYSSFAVNIRVDSRHFDTELENQMYYDFTSIVDSIKMTPCTKEEAEEYLGYEL